MHVRDLFSSKQEPDVKSKSNDSWTYTEEISDGDDEDDGGGGHGWRFPESGA